MKNRDGRPSPEELRKLLSYDAEKGVLTCNVRTAQDVRSGTEGQAKRWNDRYAGKPALTARNNSGYPGGSVHKLSYLAHIVAWAIYYGEWPSLELDHINGDRTDYRICNLREVTHTENMRNAKMPKTNKSGVVGVTYCKRDKLWLAHIKSQSIGYFKCKDDAIKARLSALQAENFHPNHGRVA